MTEYIDKVGVEVECGTDGRPEIEHFSAETDGSVRSDATESEYVSEPFEYPENKDELENALQDVYGYIVDINDSMGLHIHVSMDNDYWYYALSSLRFHDYFLNKVQESDLIEEYPELRRRLNGDSDGAEFCQEIPDADNIDTMLQRSSDGRSQKYRAVSFQKGKFDTMEFRLFCAMDVHEDVMRAIELVADSINTYIEEEEYMNGAEEKMEVDKDYGEVKKVGAVPLKSKGGFKDEVGRKLIDIIEGQREV